jgi:hypothetical protein
MTITSRRHKYNFYLTIIGVTFFFLALAAVWVTVFIVDKRHAYILLVLAGAAPIASFFVVSRYYKLTPIITIDDKTISFNTATFSLADIQKIDLTGKQNFPLWGKFLMEAATLYFRDGKTRFIYDDMYENSGALKLYLKQVVIDKEEYVAPDVNEIKVSEPDNEYFDTYKGNPVLSSNGISMWCLLAVFIGGLFIIGNKIPIGFAIFFITIALVLFFHFSRLMYYFKVSARFIVVKNHYRVLKKEVYLVDDIREVVFESRRRMPICLRIITKEFKSKLYPASTLSKSTWLELKACLEQNNITVRNECLSLKA